MRSVDEHLAAVLADITALSPLDLRLLDAQGCALSDDVSAPWDLPPFDNSSMDGYAVRSADIAGATETKPVSLPVSVTFPRDIPVPSRWLPVKRPAS